MPQINENYLKLKAGYLFPEIGRRVSAFVEANPTADVIKLGIGDVTEPLPSAVTDAMHRAVDELATRDTFRGYGPEQGYRFLRDAIAKHDYQHRGCDIDADEIFVSDGSKCDSGNILDIFGSNNTIAVTDPVYPVYVDTNVMAGNTGECRASGEYDGLVYLRADVDNQFSPALPERTVDIIYLCYPNNPTGAVASRDVLTQWVNYAREHGSVILFDAAYEAYITDPEIPHSIYEIPGACDVALEFRSFSKSAGFTGVRCGYAVVPKGVTGKTVAGEYQPLHALWNRRQSTKFNGASYIVQRGAEAAYSESGWAQIDELVAFYLDNARQILATMDKLGIAAYGGVNAPYVWLKTPGGMDSWSFFDKLLSEAHIVGTPGSGFGAAGEGYFRLSAFNSRANIDDAMTRLRRRLHL